MGKATCNLYNHLAKMFVFNKVVFDRHRRNNILQYFIKRPTSQKNAEQLLFNFLLK